MAAGWDLAEVPVDFNFLSRVTVALDKIPRGVEANQVMVDLHQEILRAIGVSKITVRLRVKNNTKLLLEALSNNQVGQVSSLVIASEAL